jgi:uncharacterized protein YkwD
MKAKLTGTLMAIVALAGCGGGSGGGSSSTSSTAPVVETPPVIVTPAPVVTVPALVTAAPASSYAARHLETFETVNRHRLACGFGALTQNTRLDAASNAHAAYIQANGRVVTHDQVRGQPGFTGATPGDRTAAAGYVGTTSEGVYVQSEAVVLSGSAMPILLLSGPYHAIDMLAGWRDVGLATSSNDLVISYGIASGVPLQTASGVRTYPCEGLSGVPFAGGNEIPSPFPTRPADFNWGAPVIVVGSGALRVSAASITGPSGSVSLAAVYADGQTADPNGRCKGSVACVIPNILAQNTKYAVVVTGTHDGVPFERTFSFTTSGVLK